MTGRIAITSPAGVSTTTARFVIASIVRIATSGHVDDRHRQVGAEPAGVVDRERAAAEVVEPELAGPGPGGDIGDGLVEAVDRELVDVADDRHDEAVVDRDGDADVDPPLGEDPVVGPVGVEGRVALERLDAGLDDERHVAEADALAGLVVALRRLAKARRGPTRRPPCGRRRAAPARARVIWAAMPLRIWVIGRRTSSAPAGN